MSSNAKHKQEITNKVMGNFNMVLLDGINISNQYIIRICWYFGPTFQ